MVSALSELLYSPEAQLHLGLYLSNQYGFLDDSLFYEEILQEYSNVLPPAHFSPAFSHVGASAKNGHPQEDFLTHANGGVNRRKGLEMLPPLAVPLLSRNRVLLTPDANFHARSASPNLNLSSARGTLSNAPSWHAPPSRFSSYHSPVLQSTTRTNTFQPSSYSLPLLDSPVPTGGNAALPPFFSPHSLLASPPSRARAASPFLLSLNSPSFRFAMLPGGTVTARPSPKFTTAFPVSTTHPFLFTSFREDCLPSNEKKSQFNTTTTTTTTTTLFPSPSTQKRENLHPELPPPDTRMRAHALTFAPCSNNQMHFFLRLKASLETESMEESRRRYFLAFEALKFRLSTEEIWKYLFYEKVLETPDASGISSKKIVGGAAGVFLLGKLYEREVTRHKMYAEEYRRCAFKAFIKCVEICPLMWCAVERIISLGVSFPHVFERPSEESLDKLIEEIFEINTFKRRLANFYICWGEDFFSTPSTTTKEAMQAFLQKEESFDFNLLICDTLKCLAKIVKSVEMYKNQEALEMLNATFSPEVHCGYILELYGRCYFELGDFEKAVPFFRHCSSLQPARTSHLTLWSTALWHLGRRVELENLVDVAFKIEGLHPEVWCVLGNFLSLTNESEEAANAFRKAVFIDDTYSFAYTLCGHELTTQEKFEEAQTMYEKAIELDPHYCAAYCGMGQVKMKQQYFQAATEYFNLALERKSNSSGIFLLQAENFELLEKKSEALNSYEAAVRCDISNSIAHYKKGLALLEFEKFQESLEAFLLAEKLAPLEGYIQIALQKAYMHTRQTKLAWHALHNALHLSLDTREQQKLHDKLYEIWHKFTDNETIQVAASKTDNDLLKFSRGMMNYFIKRDSEEISEMESQNESAKPLDVSNINIAWVFKRQNGH